MKINKKAAEAFNYIMKDLDFYSENMGQYVSCSNPEKPIERRFYGWNFANINKACKDCKYFIDIRWKRDNIYYYNIKKFRCGYDMFGEMSSGKSERIVHQDTESGFRSVRRRAERKLPKIPEHVEKQLAKKINAYQPTIVIKKPLGSVIDGAGPEDWDGVKEKTHWKRLKQLNRSIISDEEKEYEQKNS